MANYNICSNYGLSVETNIGPVSGYQQTLSTVGGDYSAFGISSGTDLTKHWLLRNKQDQVRQNGGVEYIMVPTAALTNVSSIEIRFWRRTDADSLYSYVGTTGDILGQLTASSINQVSVSGLELQEGDTIELKLVATATPCEPFVQQTGTSAKFLRADLREYTNSGTAPGDRDWETSFNSMVSPS